MRTHSFNKIVIFFFIIYSVTNNYMLFCEIYYNACFHPAMDEFKICIIDFLINYTKSDVFVAKFSQYQNVEDKIYLVISFMETRCWPDFLEKMTEAKMVDQDLYSFLIKSFDEFIKDFKSRDPAEIIFFKTIQNTFLFYTSSNRLFTFIKYLYDPKNYEDVKKLIDLLSPYPRNENLIKDLFNWFLSKKFNVIEKKTSPKKKSLISLLLPATVISITCTGLLIALNISLYFFK